MKTRLALAVLAAVVIGLTLGWMVGGIHPGCPPVCPAHEACRPPVGCRAGFRWHRAWGAGVAGAVIAVGVGMVLALRHANK